MTFGYGVIVGFLFARWVAFAVALHERGRLIRHLSRWKAWPGWRDRLIRSENVI